MGWFFVFASRQRVIFGRTSGPLVADLGRFVHGVRTIIGRCRRQQKEHKKDAFRGIEPISPQRPTTKAGAPMVEADRPLFSLQGEDIGDDIVGLLGREDEVGHQLVGSHKKRA